MSTRKTGQCLCGKIKYELTGPSTAPIYNTVCHCLNCRRATGSALFTASICPKEGFSITQGTQYKKSYWDTHTDSGTRLKRVFCGECGSKLFAYTPLWDEIVSVSAGTLDDFEAWKPDTEQYCIHRAEFVEGMKGVVAERRFDRAVKGSVDR